VGAKKADGGWILGNLKRKKREWNGRIDPVYARKVIRAEARAVADQEKRVGEAFCRAAELILALGKGARGGGRLIVTGMGKAGLIGRKLAATFASTGTPSLFLHPTEAVHGDLGMVGTHDVVLALSNSGASEEVLRLLPLLKKMRVKLVAVVGDERSPLGQEADVAVTLGRIEEPCPLRLAPSASTTAMLAVGDALALSVLRARGFSTADYARLHPAGQLGRKLLRAADCMRTGKNLPAVLGNETVAAAATRMTAARSGAVIWLDRRGGLKGIFTDGDFRRLALRAPEALREPIERHAIRPCLSIQQTALVAEAQALMSERRINALPVLDKKHRVVGLLDIQDLVGWPVL
jgi:arabinose-5-phosphate isomerase